MTHQFWRWLIFGLQSSPGYKKFKVRWLVAYTLIGWGLAFLIEMSPSQTSRVILLPLTGLLVGVCFSWVGNALTLLRSSEIEKLASFHEDGLRAYVYSFQLTVLVILTTAVAWAAAGLGVFDLECVSPRTAMAIETGLYFFAVLSLREAWQVVIASNTLLLTRSFIHEMAPPAPAGEDTPEKPD